VLDDEGGLLGVHDEPLDHLRRRDALLAVQVRRRLVDLERRETGDRGIRNGGYGDDED
jgi:hypothetical protein